MTDPFKLEMGRGLLLKGFKDYPADQLQVSFGAPGKGRYHIACYLGVFDPEADGALAMGTDERLNAMGWVFDPERAKELCEEKGI